MTIYTKRSFFFIFFLFVACNRESSIWNPKEHQPDSDSAIEHFNALFAPKSGFAFTQIREYEQGGPMDQFYLMSFVYTDEKFLHKLLEDAKFELVEIDKNNLLEKEKTATEFRKYNDSYDYDEISQKLDSYMIPDWWKKGPRIKSPIWTRKNNSYPWGYSYVWQDPNTKTVYCQTQ